MNFDAYHSQHSHKEPKYKNVSFVEVMLSHNIWYNPTMSSLHLESNITPSPWDAFFVRKDQNI